MVPGLWDMTEKMAALEILHITAAAAAALAARFQQMAILMALTFCTGTAVPDPEEELKQFPQAHLRPQDQAAAVLVATLHQPPAETERCTISGFNLPIVQTLVPAAVAVVAMEQPVIPERAASTAVVQVAQRQGQ